MLISSTIRFLIFGIFLRQQCDISAFHYSTVLNACGRAHDWPVAVQLVAAMARQEVQTDTVVYNSAINACARAKRWVEALQFLEMLRGGRWDGWAGWAGWAGSYLKST